MALIRAVTLGMIAAIGISYLMHRADYPAGGMLALHRHVLEGFSLYWSWPIFCLVTGITFMIAKLTE